MYQPKVEDATNSVRPTCAEVQEKLNNSARRVAKGKSNLGSSSDGSGFDERQPLLAIAVGHEYANFLTWSGTEASAAPGETRLVQLYPSHGP